MKLRFCYLLFDFYLPQQKTMKVHGNISHCTQFAYDIQKYIKKQNKTN